MADIHERNLTVDEMTARIEEDMASLYSDFMSKLLKTAPEKQSTVIEEYIGDRFDVRARWYLSAVHKESQVKGYLATLDWLKEKDVEALIEHFADSLPYRELVDARIVARISHWKAQAMRSVREKAAQQRIGSVVSPDPAAGSSELPPSGPAPSGAAPMTVEHDSDAAATTPGIKEAHAPASDSPGTADFDSVAVEPAKSSVPDLGQKNGGTRLQNPALEDLTGRPPNESADQALLESPLAAVPKTAITDSAPDCTFEDRLSRFMQGHLGTTLADIKYSADVHTADFQKWRKGKLKRDSVMSIRIENVLSGATPLTKKPRKPTPD